MNTLKLSAAKTERYVMHADECNDIASAIDYATHRACLEIHSQQCQVVGRENFTPAARVEMILQLAKLTATIERAGFAQSRRIASTDN